MCTFWYLQTKGTQQKALNHIPTSCSRAKFLILVTLLNLALTYGGIPFNCCIAKESSYSPTCTARPQELYSPTCRARPQELYSPTCTARPQELYSPTCRATCRPQELYSPTCRARPQELYSPTCRATCRPQELYSPTCRARPQELYSPTCRARPQELYSPTCRARPQELGSCPTHQHMLSSLLSITASSVGRLLGNAETELESILSVVMLAWKCRNRT